MRPANLATKPGSFCGTRAYSLIEREALKGATTPTATGTRILRAAPDVPLNGVIRTGAPTLGTLNAGLEIPLRGACRSRTTRAERPATEGDAAGPRSTHVAPFSAASSIRWYEALADPRMSATLPSSACRRHDGLPPEHQRAPPGALTRHGARNPRASRRSRRSDHEARRRRRCTRRTIVSAVVGSRTRLLTPAEAAAFLTLRESTLRDYSRRGIVPSVKLGRHLRFVEADLIAYLDRLRSSREIHH